MTSLKIPLFCLLSGLFAAVTIAEAATAGHDPVAALEWEFLEAETALAQREWRIAESHYRAAIREAWTALGSIAIADGDLVTARDALGRARNAAAVDLTPARLALALVELRLGEVEQPLKELRLVAQEQGTDPQILALLLQALRSAGRDEEFAAELDRLRQLDPAAADALSATPSPFAASIERVFSRVDAALRPRLQASLERIHRNLAALHELTGFAAGGTGAVAEDEARGGAEPFGKIDLDGDGSARRVEAFHVSPVRLMSTAAPSLRSAIILLDSGETERAEAELRGLSNTDDGAEALAVLGSILAARGQTEAAAAEFSKAIEKDPDHPLAHQGLGRLHWLNGRRSEAIGHLRQAAEHGPLERDLAWALAEVEQTAGRTDAARRLLSSIDRRFDSAEALLRMSEISRRAGEEKQALDAVQRALRLAPSSEEVLLRHARLALDAGIVDSAAISVEPLVRMHPGVAEYRYLLGSVWAQRRKMGEASEALLEAVELDPDFLPAYLPLGLALNHESRFEEASSFLRRYLETHPDDLDARAGLAEAEERLGDADGAEKQARAVLAEDPDHARALLVLGMVHAGRDEFAPARTALERATEADPWLAKAHYQLSFACARLGDRDCASEHLALYKKALEGIESTYVELEAKGEATLMKKAPSTVKAPETMMKEKGSSR